MADAFTGTSAVSNLVQTAYDRYVEFALRSQPLVRMVADKFPGQQAMPGSTVKLSLYSDLAIATTPLSELVDPDAVAIANPSQVTVTFNEYGNVTKATRLANLLAFSEIDPAILNILAYNMVDSLDNVALATLRAGTNVVYSTEAAFTTFDTTGPTNTVAAGDKIDAKYIRFAVTKLRTGNAIPRKGDLYWAGIHPEASYDLRAATGAGSWRDPHVYNSNEAIWQGEIGAFEGAFFIETNRMFQATDGTTSQKVSRTIVAGQQALAEAIAEEPHLEMGPSLDKLNRFKHVGWKGVLGFAVYRQPALWRIESSTTL